MKARPACSNNSSQKSLHSESETKQWCNKGTWGVPPPERSTRGRNTLRSSPHPTHYYMWLLYERLCQLERGAVILQLGTEILHYISKTKSWILQLVAMIVHLQLSATIGVNPGDWGGREPKIWNDGSWGSWDLHEIFLYHIMYRNIRWEHFKKW